MHALIVSFVTHARVITVQLYNNSMEVFAAPQTLLSIRHIHINNSSPPQIPCLTTLVYDGELHWNDVMGSCMWVDRLGDFKLNGLH